MRRNWFRLILMILILLVVVVLVLQFMKRPPSENLVPTSPPPATRLEPPGPMPPPRAPTPAGERELHTYFFYPDGSERYLGTTRGNDGCARIAGNYAAAQNFQSNAKWSYSCCASQGTADCQKKLR